MDTTPDADDALDPDDLIPGTRTRSVPENLWNRMRADPLHSPEHLALAAVEMFGPEAQRWIADFRAKFPHVTVAHMAMVTRTRFTRLSTASGAAAGVAGGVGAVLDVGVLAWNQARMVIYLATIYGEDPTSRDRAAELLVLQNVHKVTQNAQLALDLATRRVSAGEVLNQKGDGSIAKASLQVGLALGKMVGFKLGKKALMKLVPLASIPLGAMANSASTRKLADKAIAMYAYRRFHQRGALPPGAKPPDFIPPDLLTKRDAGGDQVER